MIIGFFLIIFILILLNNLQNKNNIYLYIYKINLVIKNNANNIKKYFKNILKEEPEKNCNEPGFVSARNTEYLSRDSNHVPLYKMTKLRTLDLNNTTDIIGYVSKYLDTNYDKNIEK